MDTEPQCIGCTPVMLERLGSATLGVSRRTWQGLVADGVLRRVRPGVVVGECVWRRAEDDRRLADTLQLRALLLSYPDCVASHESAALALTLPLLEVPAYSIITRERGAWRGGAMMRVRIAPLPTCHVTVADDVRCTTLARTVADIARSGSFREAVVVGDAALRRGADAESLRAVVDECSRWADVGKARRALRFLDGRSESAFESVSRAIMHEHDVPAPELQAEFSPGRSTTYRVDFYWDGPKVVGEADGMQKYDDPGALRAEKIRQEQLERLGLTVVRWTWREMLVDTDETIARIRAALSR